VYEDKRTGYTEESQALLQRNMDARFIPVDLTEQTNASLSLRPQRDDIRTFFKPTVSTGDKRS
jgi:hypothetical protein